MEPIREADWKQFKRIREIALDRYCESALNDLVSEAENPERPLYDRFLNALALLKDRNKRLNRIFENLSRSDALFQLSLLYVHKLIEASELDAFTPDVRAWVLSFPRHETPDKPNDTETQNPHQSESQTTQGVMNRKPAS